MLKFSGYRSNILEVVVAPVDNKSWIAAFRAVERNRNMLEELKGRLDELAKRVSEMRGYL